MGARAAAGRMGPAPYAGGAAGRGAETTPLTARPRNSPTTATHPSPPTPATGQAPGAGHTGAPGVSSLGRSTAGGPPTARARHHTSHLPTRDTA